MYRSFQPVVQRIVRWSSGWERKKALPSVRIRRSEALCGDAQKLGAGTRTLARPTSRAHGCLENDLSVESGPADAAMSRRQPDRVTSESAHYGCEVVGFFVASSAFNTSTAFSICASRPFAKSAGV